MRSQGATRDGPRPRKAARRGQALVEYVLLAAMLVLTVSVVAVFLYAFRENSGRVLDLAASEYP